MLTLTLPLFSPQDVYCIRALVRSSRNEEKLVSLYMSCHIRYFHDNGVFQVWGVQKLANTLEGVGVSKQM